jgi:DnaA family protein
LHRKATWPEGLLQRSIQVSSGESLFLQLEPQQARHRGLDLGAFMKTPPPQLLLGLSPEPEPSLSNFVDGGNAAASHALRHWAELSDKDRFIHLWGAAGSGRTHLLKAMAAQMAGIYCNLAEGAEVPVFSGATTVYCIDQVDSATDLQQAALFQLINQCRAHPGTGVLTSAFAAPAHLALREDLRTRLGWGLVFALERLADADIEAALSNHALELGFDLSSEVRRYLMTHLPRDLRVLTHLLEELDRYGLATHRPVTLPLLKNFLDQAAPLSTGEPLERDLGA